MSLYQKIKSAITVRQVGEMYGMEPDRHGMVCCPFHSDSDPSMKLNDTYYYCFGCGANGDAIDLTAKLFDLNPRQAAEKLAHDFGLDPDKPPANAIALPPPKRGLTDEQWADIAYCLRVLTDYLDLLHDWQERYKPTTLAQRAELDWLLYNKPLEYAQLVLGGGMEHYLSLGCDHGRLED